MLRNTFILLIIGLVIFQSCFSGEDKYVAIKVRGSDSEVNLVQALAENFMDQDSLVSVGVTGGGSGAGIAALINGKTDLANSSREITEEELEFARKANVQPYPIVFAQDALAIITHKDNPVDSLSLEEISAIYSGKIENWNKVEGGNNEEISLYGRQSSSGTYIYFRENIVKGEYKTSMIGMSGTAQIVDALKTDKNGIGYVSSGYLSENIMKDIKVLKINADDNSTAYVPNKENITSGTYPITRPLLQFTNGKPEGKLLEFILYQFSEEGMKIIEENGFYPADYSTYNKELFQK